MNTREFLRLGYRYVLAVSHTMGLASLMRLINGKQGHYTIVLYHGVEMDDREGFRPGDGLFVSVDDFRRQVRFLKRHFDLISVSDLVERVRKGVPAGRSTAAVTFDDGYANTLVGAAVLKEFEVPFTVFLSTDFIGSSRQTWWGRVASVVAQSDRTVGIDWQGELSTYSLARTSEKRRLIRDAGRHVVRSPNAGGDDVAEAVESAIGVPAEFAEDFRFMSWSQVRELNGQPLVDLGSHACSHRVLSCLSDADLEHELRESRARIEAESGKPVVLMAYPYGSSNTYNDRVITAARQAGYLCGLAGVEGLVKVGDSPYQLKRVSIQGFDSWPIFVAKVSGVGQYLRAIADGFV